MKAITIRDLRLCWPAIERALPLEKEMIITRDGRPVAKLIEITKKEPRRTRWEPGRHKDWLNRFWKGREVNFVEKYLQSDRADRIA